MSTVDELRHLLCARRADRDVIRVFADALAQEGDRRGEVILRELALADDRLDPGARLKVRQELRQLAHDSAALWLPSAMQVKTELGLPVSARLSEKLLLELGPDRLVEELPGVRHLEFRLTRVVDATEWATALNALCAHPLAAALESVHVWIPHGPRHRPRVEDFAFRPGLAVQFSGGPLSSSTLQAVLDRQIGALGLANRIEPVDELVWGLRSTRLRRLAFTRGQRGRLSVAKAGRAALSHGGLRELALTDVASDANALVEWGGSPTSAALEHLDFSRSRWRGSFWASLAAAGPFPRLEALRVDHVSSTDTEIEPFVEALPRLMPNLRRLDARGLAADLASALGRAGRSGLELVS